TPPAEDSELAETHLGAPVRWMPLSKRAEKSLDPARTRACATKTGASQIPRHQEFEDSIRQKVLDLVVEKTGYPKDMLDLDLDLEADLGIDTVKQAEM